MLDHELLRTFVAVVDTGSFTRAAAQVFRTQSAVSMQMKRLEEQLQKTLFIKDKRELQLTDDGEKLVLYARQILRLHDEALGVLSDSSGNRPLLLGCPEDYVTGVLPSLLTQIHQRQPQLQVQVRTGTSAQLRQMLDEGLLDVSILTRRPEKEEGYLLLQDKGVWVAPNAEFIQQQSVLPLALVLPDCKFHTTAVDGLTKQGKPFKVICIAAHGGLLIEMVHRGEAISMLPACAVPDDLYRVPPAAGLPEAPTVEIVLQNAAQPHPDMRLDTLPDIAAATAAELMGGRIV